MLLSPLWDDSEGSEPNWRLYAIATDDGCPVEEFLENCLSNANLERYANGLIDLIYKIGQSEKGPRMFEGNSGICHEAVDGEAIYRLRKGDVRLYFFYGNDRKVVICPHGEVKRSERVSKATKRLLIQARDSYNDAHKKNALRIIGT